ncbi:MAG: hypothetical protein PHT07_22465 [Paludibacter sp.]|nr:hypothetical protein [Paludibacter sp.]
MKNIKIPLIVLAFIFALVACLYSSCKPTEKPLNISVSFEVVGRAFDALDRDGRKYDDFFSKVTVTNHEVKPISFGMMLCSWLNQTLIFDKDSMEFSYEGCDKDFPITVELKPGKSIVFYPVFHSNSKKNDQIRMGFVMMKEDELDNRYRGWAKFIRTKHIYWSNPVSMKGTYNNVSIPNSPCVERTKNGLRIDTILSPFFCAMVLRE